MNRETSTIATPAAQVRSTPRPPFEAERLLAAAGITFTEVDCCPVPGCSICSRRGLLPTAA